MLHINNLFGGFSKALGKEIEELSLYALYGKLETLSLNLTDNIHYTLMEIKINQNTPFLHI